MTYKFKKSYIIRLSIIALIMLSSLTISFYLGNIITNYNKNLDKKQALLKKKKQEFLILKNQKNIFTNQKELWLQLDIKNRNYSDLQIDEGISTIENLSNQYNINNLALKFTTPSEIGKRYGKYSIVMSKGKMSYTTMLDIDALSFLQQLSQLNGYVQIDKLTINAEPDLSQVDLSELIKVDVAFSWYDIKINK